MGFKETCKDCVQRHMGCHSSCEAYLEAKAEYEAEKAMIVEQKDRKRDYDDHKFASIEKAVKRRRER